MKKDKKYITKCKTNIAKKLEKQAKPINVCDKETINQCLLTVD